MTTERDTSVDLIIFDNDGVLVDSEPIVNRLFVAAIAWRDRMRRVASAEAVRG